MAIACRTLLDLRPATAKYVSQAFLLAASWHKHVAGSAPLRVGVIGDGAPGFHAFLYEVGAECEAMPPGPNDGFSRSSNKIQMAYPDAGGNRVLLLDNDTCFLAAIDGLHGLRASAIVAAQAGRMRISDAQWQVLDSGLGTPLLRRRYRVVDAQPVAPVPDDGPADGYLYLNSGVVLFPAGLDPRSDWYGRQARIRALFEGHPLASPAVAGSDQAGFAALVGMHGDFAWLPLRFNFRRGCFRLGSAPSAPIAILHLTGNVPDSDAMGLEERVMAYWSRLVMPGVSGLGGAIPPAEQARRVEDALSARDAVLGIIREYDLDRRVRLARAPAVRRGPGA